MKEVLSETFKGGGGFQVLNFWKQFFEITIDLKNPPGGPTFWSNFEPQTLWRQLGGHAYFPANDRFIISKKHQNYDIPSPIDR